MSSTDPDIPDCMDEGFLSCREDCGGDDDASPSASSASVTTTSPTSGVPETSTSSFTDIGENAEGDQVMSEYEDSREDNDDNDDDSSTKEKREEAESTPPSSATIGDDFLVFRKAPKRSFVKASSDSSCAELKPKKTSLTGIVDYPSSSSSSSSTTSLDSGDDNDDKEVSNSTQQIPSTSNPADGRENSRPEEEDEVSRVGPRIRRRLGPRMRPRLIRDDSDDEDEVANNSSATANVDSNENPEIDEEEEDDREEGEKEEEDDDLGVLPVGPKPNWFCLKELRHREYGGRKSRGDEYRGDFLQKTRAALLWVEKFDLTCRLDDHQGCVNSLNFNDSGTRLASGSDDLNVIIWDWAKAVSATVRAKNVMPVSPGSSRHRRSWERDRGDSSASSAAAIVAKYESGHRANIFQTKFLPFTNDGVVISCARDGQVRIADLDSDGSARHGTRKLAIHKGSAHKLSTLSDSSHVILSCGEDAAVKSVDLRADDPDCDILVTREGSVRVPLYSIHVNPLNSDQFITSGRDPWVRFYDRRMLSSSSIDDDASSSTKKNAATPVKKFCPHPLVPKPAPATEKRKNAPYHQKANVSCAVFSHDGSQILASYNDDDIYLFDASHSDGADSVKRYQGHRNNATVKAVNFYGPKSEYVVSGSDCGHVFIWDKETEQVVQFLSGDDGGVVNVLEPHPCLPYLATSGLDHDVKLWSPIKDGGPDFSSLLKTMKKNGKERESDSGGDGALMDGHMLWFLMQHLRRRRRRRMRAEGSGDADDDGDDNDNSTEEEDENEEDEDEDDVSRVVDCNPS